jgi:cyclopropane-fatty-acyl-phospholipid synthase
MGSTKAQIAVSYDVGNEFFALWLDERMNYSCAVFEGNEDLETAQLNKLAWLYDAAHIGPEKHVLDIGCGWGANLRYLTRDRGVRRATGLTLSEKQAAFVRETSLPGVTIAIAPVLEWTPTEKFDAIQSIGMVEHLVTRQETIDGTHLGKFRAFFRRAWEWSTPGAWFGLQSIVAGHAFARASDVRRMVTILHRVFPGGWPPRAETLLACLEPHWELIQVRTRRESYARTTAEWLRRLRARRTEIVERWGEQVFADYEEYLAWCVRAFSEHTASLVQVGLRRIDA